MNIRRRTDPVWRACSAYGEWSRFVTSRMWLSNFVSVCRNPLCRHTNLSVSADILRRFFTTFCPYFGCSESLKRAVFWSQSRAVWTLQAPQWTGLIINTTGKIAAGYRLGTTFHSRNTVSKFICVLSSHDVLHLVPKNEIYSLSCQRLMYFRETGMLYVTVSANTKYNVSEGRTQCWQKTHEMNT